tara:strand:+ start:1662 stop:2153 length:492 start_codon:yes stop_codon:yes gene_type:complete
MEIFLPNIAILCTWVVLWMFFYFGGSQVSTLQYERVLLVYTTLTLVSIFGFYVVLNSTLERHSIDLFTVAGYACLLIGALLVMLARIAMKNITATEILFAINPAPEFTGIYTYFHHPMYIGILTIMAGSFLLIPNFAAIPFVLLTAIFMYKKGRVEESRHGMG